MCPWNGGSYENLHYYPYKCQRYYTSCYNLFCNILANRECALKITLKAIENAFGNSDKYKNVSLCKQTRMVLKH